MTAHKRLDAFEAVFQVAQLTVKRSFKGWRGLVALAVVLLPAALAALVRSGGANGNRFIMRISRREPHTRMTRAPASSRSESLFSCP